MRNLKSYNERDAQNELRDGEELLPAGGYGDINFYSAVDDEDFIPDRKEKEKHRRDKRREKQNKRWAG